MFNDFSSDSATGGISDRMMTHCERYNNDNRCNKCGPLLPEGREERKDTLYLAKYTYKLMLFTIQ